jgi:hypothetical protein
MTLPKEIFDTIRQVKKFSTLDLRFSYHLLLLKEDDKVKITFWGIDSHGKLFVWIEVFVIWFE